MPWGKLTSTHSRDSRSADVSLTFHDFPLPQMGGQESPVTLPALHEPALPELRVCAEHSLHCHAWSSPICFCLTSEQLFTSLTSLL